MVRFIIGRSGTGKTTKCLEEIAACQKEHSEGSVIFIVPEQFTLQSERDLIKKTDGNAMLKAGVLSFKRLAYNIFSKEGNAKTTHLSGTAKVMALRKILAERSDELKFFRGLSDKTGFMRQLSEMITELFNYGIEPENLVLEDNPDKYLKGKLEDLSLIYKDYKAFSESFLTDDETLNELAEKMENSSLIKGAKIWIDGFFGFTPQEYGIIRRLIRCAESVTITLTIDVDTYRAKNVDVSSIFFEPWNTARKIKEICKEENEKLTAMASDKAFRYKSGMLKCLEESYVNEDVSCDLTDGVAVYEAASLYDEVEFAAREISHLVRDKNMRYRDISLLVSSPESYHTAIKGIFDEYDIPVFMDNKTKAALHPLSEAVRSVIDIIAYDFSYENVFSYLKTGFSGLSKDEIDVLENYCLAYGIKGYKWRLKNWGFGKSRYSEEEISALNELKERVTEPFNDFYEVCGNGRKAEVKTICKNVVEFLKKINAVETISKQTDEFKLNGRTDRAYENEQCWSAVMQVLSDAAKILGDIQMTMREFAAIFEAGITDVDVGIIPYGIDNVTVGDIKRSRLPDTKALFILGVNDGLIPSGNATDRLINDDEREFLDKKGIELASWGRRKSFEEEFLIYGAISKAEERLYLTYATGDIDGGERKPSVIITKALKTFPDLRAKRSADYEDVFSVVNEKTAAKAANKNSVFGKSAEKALLDLGRVNALKNTMKIKNNIGKMPRLDKELAERLYSNGVYTSISRLERYASCPFSYFVEYNLNAKERKLYSIEAPDMGSILHEIIERLSRELLDRGINWKDVSQNECEALVEEIVEKIIPNVKDELFSSSGSMRYMVNRLKRVAKKAVWVLMKHIKAGHFVPCGYEVGFGAGEEMPPVVIRLDDGSKLVLNGKIDRIDYFDKDGVRFVKIIDYKSGKKQFDFTEVYYGLQLQLALYMDSVLKSLDKLGVNAYPGGMFYYRVMDPAVKFDKTATAEEIEASIFKEFKMSGLVLQNDEVYKALDMNGYEASAIIPLKIMKSGEPDSKSKVADVKSYKKVMEYAENKAASLGNDIIKGEIPVSPIGSKAKSPCSYCAYKAICLIDDEENRGKGRRLEKKTVGDF